MKVGSKKYLYCTATATVFRFSSQFDEIYFVKEVKVYFVNSCCVLSSSGFFSQNFIKKFVKLSNDVWNRNISWSTLTEIQYFYFLYLVCNLCLKTPSQPSHQRSTPTTRPLEGAIITVPTTSESLIIWSTYLFRNKICKGKSMLKNRNTIPKSLSWGQKRRWNLGKPVFLSVKRDNLRYVLDNLSLLFM